MSGLDDSENTDKISHLMVIDETREKLDGLALGIEEAEMSGKGSVEFYSDKLEDLEELLDEEQARLAALARVNSQTGSVRSVDTNEFEDDMANLNNFTGPSPSEFIHEAIGRESAEAALVELSTPGSFLVRKKNTIFILSCLLPDGRCKHIKIHKDNEAGLLTIHNNSFISWSHLIGYYMNVPLFEDYLLQHPVSTEKIAALKAVQADDDTPPAVLLADAHSGTSGTSLDLTTDSDCTAAGTPAVQKTSRSTSVSGLEPILETSSSSDPTTMVAGFDAGNAKYKKREHIIREIYDTEKNYVDGLVILDSVYYKPLNALTRTTKSIMDKAHIETIFYRISDILSKHKALLQSMDDRFKAGDAGDANKITGDSLIGDLFCNLAHLFEDYAAFVNNQGSAMLLIRQYRQKPEYISQVDNVFPSLKSAKKRTLNDLMIQPVQRIPRYSMFMDALIKVTPPSHPDYNNIVSASETLKELTQLINEAKRVSESIEEVFHLQQRMVDSPPSLESATRRFITEQRIVELDGGSAKDLAKRKWTAIILLSDMIIVAKPLTGRSTGVSLSNNGGSSSANTTLKYTIGALLSDLVCTKTPDLAYDEKEAKAIKADMDKLNDQIAKNTPSTMGTMTRKTNLTKSFEKQRIEFAEKKAQYNFVVARYGIQFMFQASAGRKARTVTCAFVSPEERDNFYAKFQLLQRELHQGTSPLHSAANKWSSTDSLVTINDTISSPPIVNLTKKGSRIKQIKEEAS